MNLLLLREVVTLALDTLRTNKLRSALTVLGVVIGITAIVGMTSLIRGFDESLRDSIRQLGPNTIFVAKFSGVSLAAGRDFADLMRRPNLTVDDAKAIQKLAPAVQNVDIWLAPMGDLQDRVVYNGNRMKLLNIIGATEEYATLSFVKLQTGRLFSASEVEHRRKVVVLGDTPYQVLFAQSGLDPVNKKVRIGAAEFTVIGVLGKRPSAGVGPPQDDFVVIPQTTHQALYGTRATRAFRGAPTVRSAMIAVLPREDAGRDKALAEVEEIMRVRHGHARPRRVRDARADADRDRRETGCRAAAVIRAVAPRSDRGARRARPAPCRRRCRPSRKSRVRARTTTREAKWGTRWRHAPSPRCRRRA